MRFVATMAAACLVAGCGKGDTLVVVTVDSTMQLADVPRLHAQATAGGRTAAFDVAARGATTLPPTRTFGVTVPSSVTGSFSILVQAIDSTGAVVSDGSCQTSLSPGHRVDCTATLGGGGGDGGMPDLAGSDGGAGDVPARLLAPLSTATVTSRRPTLHWQMPTGAANPVVELCTNRAMTAGCITIAANPSGTSAVPTADLPAGVLFWRVRTGVGTTATSAIWQFNGAAATLATDTSWGTTLDVDGDGFADVAVSAFNNVGTTEAGPPVAHTYLYRGSASGIGTNALTKWEPAGGTNDAFGSVVTSAGDLNGDGFADFAIGASATGSGNGAVQIFFGGPGGLGTTPPPTTMAPSVILTPPTADTGGNFGSAVASIGDLDGDGYADLAVGAPLLTVAAATTTGRVYIFYGGPSFGGAGQRVTTIDGRNGAGSQFGNALSSAGDVNGDGFADLIVASWAVGQTNAKGFAYLYLGGAGGLANNASPAVNIVGNDANGRFGHSVGFGDFNCDGKSDVVIGAFFGLNASSAQTGNAVVFRGDAAKGLNVMDPNLTTYGDGYVFYGAAAGAKFGNAVAGAGDVDRDGCGDLVIGAPSDTGDVGKVYVYRGSSTFSFSTAPIAVPSPHASDTSQFGSAVAGGGDITGSGYATVLAGAPNPVTGSGASAMPWTNYLYIFLGGTSGTATTLPNSWQTQQAPTMPTLESGMGFALY